MNIPYIILLVNDKYHRKTGLRLPAGVKIDA